VVYTRVETREVAGRRDRDAAVGDRIRDHDLRVVERGEPAVAVERVALRPDLLGGCAWLRVQDRKSVLHVLGGRDHVGLHVLVGAVRDAEDVRLVDLPQRVDALLDRVRVLYGRGRVVLGPTGEGRGRAHGSGHVFWRPRRRWWVGTTHGRVIRV